MTKQFNVLLTSSGKKVPLVAAFKAALKQQKGIKGRVVCCDMDRLSASFLEADRSYLTHSATHPDYINDLIKICKKEKIRILIPFIDAELLPLAENKRLFEENGTEVIVSEPEVIKLCADKYKTCAFFIKNNIPTPKTFLPGEIKKNKSIKFPLFIKPRYGFSSKDAFIINNLWELRFFITYIDSPLIQEYISGSEITVDALADLRGKVINVIPRQRIEVMAGHSVKGRTIKDAEIAKYSIAIIEKLKPAGPVTLQCFRNKKGIKFTEINPRFGSGLPLSLAAGADYLSLLIKMVMGREVKPMAGKFKKGVFMLRYFAAKFINGA